MGPISLMWSVMSSPVWLPWRAYRGLWWVFDDPPRKWKGEAAAAGAMPGLGVGVESGRGEAGQGRAFEVVDSRPRAQPLVLPVGPARLGFVATLATAVVTGLVLGGAAGGGAIEPARAAAAWVWLTGIATAGTLWAVRKTAIAREERRARSVRARVGARASVLWADVKGRVKAGVESVKGAGVGTGASVGVGGAAEARAAAGGQAQRCGWNWARCGAAADRACAKVGERVGAGWQRLRG